MNYADKTGVPYVVFLGEDEVKNNVIACKDMTSGEQTTLDFAATLARIRDGLPRGTRAGSSWRSKRLTLRRKAFPADGCRGGVFDKQSVIIQ